jgi:hypothetical protein
MALITAPHEQLDPDCKTYDLTERSDLLINRPKATAQAKAIRAHWTVLGVRPAQPAPLSARPRRRPAGRRAQAGARAPKSASCVGDDGPAADHAALWPDRRCPARPAHIHRRVARASAGRLLPAVYWLGWPS